MGFEAWGYRFEGPVPLPDYLSTKPGVFIVWCVSDGTWDILEAGDADNVKHFLLSRDHLQDHDLGYSYQIYFSAAHIESPEERIKLLKDIKGPSFVPCDIAALKKKDALYDHTRFFDGRRIGWKLRHLISRMVRIPSIPRRLVRGFEEKMEEFDISKNEIDQ